MSIPKLYNMKRLAEFIGISRVAIQKRYKKGQLLAPVYKVGESPVWSETQAKEMKKTIKGDVL